MWTTQRMSNNVTKSVCITKSKYVFKEISAPPMVLQKNVRALSWFGSHDIFSLQSGAMPMEMAQWPASVFETNSPSGDV